MATIGLIGKGRWGRNIENTLQSFPDVTVVSIKRGETFSTHLDGVCIATQSATHAEISLPYIEKGIATFIEKPLATSVVDARRLQAAAQKSGALVHVGHIHLYNPAFRKLLELLPSIGTIHSLLFEGMNSTARTDSSVMWDWLPHDFSMALSIFKEEPTNIQAWSRGGGNGHTAGVQCNFGRAVMQSAISWESPIKRRFTLVVGERGSIALDDTATLKLTLKLGDTITQPAYDSDMPLTLELRAFIDAIENKSHSNESLTVGVSVVSLIAAAEAAAKNSDQV